MVKFALVFGLFVLFAFSAAPSLASGSSVFVDVPITDPAYVQLASVQKAVFVDLGPLGTMSGKRTMVPYEFAVILMRVLPVITPSLQSRLLSDNLQPSPMRLLPNARQRLEADPQAVADLRTLLRRFAPVMRKLGKYDAAINSGLAYFNLTFRDVPPDHWAAASVEHLRELGLIVGYSDSDFQENETPVARTTFDTLLEPSERPDVN